MHLLDLTRENVAENLSLDEALLEEAESGRQPFEVLRLWESPQPAVVVGRSSKVREEVNLEACRKNGVPVFRRCSGGASVMIGPGCLMYALVLSYELRPALRSIEEAHQFVLGTMVESINRVSPRKVEQKGISDLAYGDRKVSGNSLRCKRTHLLYHGTLLYDFPPRQIAECLLAPPRQPEYRAGRSHEQFVAELSLSTSDLRRSLVETWRAQETLDAWPRERTERLARDRYNDDDWNYRR